MTTLLILLVVLCIAAISLIHIVLEDKEITLFATTIVCTVIVSILLGTTLNQQHKTKKKKVPTLEIECKYGKCDTTYVYNFK